MNTFEVQELQNALNNFKMEDAGIWDADGNLSDSFLATLEKPCPHGIPCDGERECTVNAAGRTSCCDSDETYPGDCDYTVCRCCWAEVIA